MSWEKRVKSLTVVIEKEDDLFVALSPQLDIASQGSTIDEAGNNLMEAMQLFYEHASVSEIEERFERCQE